MDGVISIHADGGAGTVRVRFSNQAVAEQALRARLDELGYEPAP